MYYFIYVPLYALSLLPFRILYFFSDCIYTVLFYGICYRRKVVMHNLTIAFPDKTEKERLAISKKFYRNFIDCIVETVKLLSLSDKEFSKRFTSNVEVVNTLYETGLNAQFVAGHFFNWEFINWGVAKYCKYPWAGVYMPLSNKIFDRIMYKMRSRYNTILIPATQFKTNFDHYVKDRYALGLAADQNPSSCDNAYWINFFGRLTPFIKGPEKGAKTKNTAVVFGHFYAVKRGHYHTEFEILTTKPSLFADGELTRLFVRKMEEAIKKVPHNYLWSHRRWKYSYNDEKHAHLCVRS